MAVDSIRKKKREWEKQGKAYSSAARKNEVEVGKAAVDRLVDKRAFEYFDRPTRGIRFHIFKQKGDEIVGKLVSHAISNIRRNSSYAIQIEGGEIVEVFANKTLHKQLSDCFYQQIRIVYIGREQNKFGHAKKVYRVYKEFPDQPVTSGKIKKKLESRRKESDDGK
ncbi:hypothetical protein LCGC14_1075720 [marine sediment metagenome]|uniref:Uncharacterized protein n=1 Tax=marine sediment metagenome TaxID=412755 RepID=A0A0F9QMJ6_9ZZZZ